MNIAVHQVVPQSAFSTSLFSRTAGLFMMVSVHCDDRNKIWQLASGNQQTWSGIEAMTRAFLPHPGLCKAPLRLPGYLFLGCSAPSHRLSATTLTQSGGWQTPKREHLSCNELPLFAFQLGKHENHLHNNFKSNGFWRWQMRAAEIPSCQRVRGPVRRIKRVQGHAVRECEDEKTWSACEIPLSPTC